MKKKIINGILMVALLAATSTSFVSCKDNTEDVKTDLMAQVNALKADLEPRMEKAEGEIASLNTRMTTAEGEIDQLQTDVQTLRNDLTALEGRVAQNETDIATLQTDVTDLQTRMGDVETKITNLWSAFENLITSVNVNATSTSILENSKVFPGINMQFLGAAYGKAVRDGVFPSSDAGDYIAGHGLVLNANEISTEITPYEFDYDQTLNNQEGNAGTIYFTVNPSNITLKDVTLSLVNSQLDAPEYLTIGEATQSDKVIEWGTRAEEQKLWEAPATIDLKDDALVTLDPTKIIKFEALAQDVKDIFNTAKSVQKSKESVKSTSKEVLKLTAKAVATLVEAKVPALPALAMRAQWGDDVVGVRSVLSDYSIAATAYKPLAFDFGGGLVEARTISLDRIDALAARIQKAVKKNIPNLTKYIVNDITIGNNGIITVTIGQGDFGTDTWGIDIPNADTDLDIDMTSLKTEINDNFVAMINQALSDMTNLTNKIGKYTDRAYNATDKVTDYLENYINRFINKIAVDGFTRALEPILLLEGDKDVSRFAATTVFNAGNYRVIPTTMTKELIAPAFKKYVAIVKDGKVVKYWFLTKGEADFNGFEYEFAAGNYTVVYSALDFSGNQIAKKYNVTVQ